MAKKEIEEKERRRKIIDKIIEVILIIIIILLLLHTCELSKKNGKNSGKTNIINITCDDKKCDIKQEIPIDCLINENSSKCIVPNFVGKTKEDILKWLSTIANTIDIEFKTVKSDKKTGTVLDQSISGITIKELLASKNKLIITIADNGSLVDCLSDENNSKCMVPNFVGKTKNDVNRWLNTITNYVKVKYVYQASDAKAGTILGQSIKSGKKIKDVINSGETLIITIATNNSSNNNKDKDKDESQDEGDEEEITGEFYVDDSNVRWSDETELKIFVDSLYNVPGKIAPESSNTYKFVLHNKTSYNLKYNISFIETNPYNMNMKYKLKKNGSYIVSNYVSYDQLNLTGALLNSKENDTFDLEWKWVSSDNDTAAGKAEANYKLKINVEAESVDE